MKQSMLIAKLGISRAKGQSVAIIVLILLAAMLLNLWLMLSLDYHANFARCHDRLHAEHVTLVVDQTDPSARDYLSNLLSGDDRVAEYRLDDCMVMVGMFDYNGGSMNCEFVFMDRHTALSRTIGQAEMVEDSTLTSGIYLPMLYKSSDYTIGNTIELSIGSTPVTYTICGFFNSAMLGSNNCVLTQVILTQDKYAELQDSGIAPQATLCSVRMRDPADNIRYESALKSAVSAHFPTARMASNCYDTVYQARYISQGICSIVMSAMAFLVLLIALVVIVSNIGNYIQVNFKNLGVLKAVGYTSRQLIAALLLQFLSLTLLAALAGVGISYGIFPAVNTLMTAQTGIPYAIRFLPLPLLLSLVILGGAVALAVWLSARKIKKIDPIVALRSGVQTHNFKRDHIPLHRTKMPLPVALALKNTLAGAKHNITVCITMLVLSLVIVFSGLMTENVIVDTTPFVHLIVGETADSCINVQAEIESDFLASLEADSRVEKIYLYHSINVSHAGGADLLAVICDDFDKVNNQNVIFQGRFPQYDNEIAIAAKYAKENDLHVGDQIEMESSGITQPYLICGLTQVTNYLGKDCLLTRQGYHRLGTLTNASYYLNIAKGVDIDAFNAEVSQPFADNINAAINISSVLQASSGVYVSLMTIIVLAILLLTVIIIAFVLYSLVRTMLNNKMRDYGILKSLGYTTHQLILQTALTFMPSVILSTVIGITIGCFAINPLLSLFLSALGIVKCTFAIPVAYCVLAGIALVILSFGLACLMSLRIKKITPCTLLAAE